MTEEAKWIRVNKDIAVATDNNRMMKNKKIDEATLDNKENALENKRLDCRNKWRKIMPENFISFPNCRATTHRTIK